MSDTPNRPVRMRMTMRSAFVIALGVLAVFFLRGYLTVDRSPPTEDSSLEVAVASRPVDVLQHVLREQNGDEVKFYDPFDPGEAYERLTPASYDKNLTLTFSGAPYAAPRYTVYSSADTLIGNADTLTGLLPEESGNYLVVVDVDWGNETQNVLMQYLFLLRVDG